MKSNAAFYRLSLGGALLLLLCLSAGNASAAAVSRVWDGGGADNNFSTANNWNPNGTPVNGDDVTFDGTSAKVCVIDANTANLAGFVITNAYTGNITNPGNFTVTLTAGSFSQQGSSFSLGNGTLTISGNNQDFSVSGGTFNAGGGSINIDDDFTISGTGTFTAGTSTLTFTGNGTSTLTTNGQNVAGLVSGAANTIQLAADTSATGNVTINNTGKIDLNAHTLSVTGTMALNTGTVTTTVGGALSLAGDLTSGAATITGSPNLTLTGGSNQAIAGIAGLGTFTVNKSGNTATLGGNVSGVNFTMTAGTVTGSTITATTAISFDSGTVSSIVAGAANATKTGTGTVTLSGAAVNTYTGTTTIISGGTLVVAKDGALGTAAGSTTVNSGGTLAIQGGTTYAVAEPLTLNGTGVGAVGALNNVSGANSFAGPITLASATTIGSATAANVLTLSGGIGGATQSVTFTGAGDVTVSGAIATTTGVLTKNGAGTLLLSGTNTYTGTTIVNTGTLQASGGTAIADASGVTINNTAIFELLNDETIGALGGAVAGPTVKLNANTLTINENANTTYGGTITGTGGIIKTNTGLLALTNASTYDGATAINAGAIFIQNNTALGSTTGATTVAAGAGLVLGSNITVAENLSIAGTGPTAAGAIENNNGANTLSGTITMTADSTIGTTAGSITASGVVSGNFALTKIGSGTLTLSGPNTYGGLTNINVGTLDIKNASALGATTAGTVVASGATLQYSAGGVNYDAEPLTVSGAGVGGLGALQKAIDGGVDDISGPIMLAASATFASNELSNVNFFQIDGIVSGAAGSTLTIIGPGLTVLTAANDYDGATVVSSGTLGLAFGGMPGSTVGGTTIAAGAELYIEGALAVAGESLTLNGTGAGYNGSTGALSNAFGDASWSGNITLNTDTTIEAGSGNNLDLSGVIGDGGNNRNLTKTGGGVLILDGANTYGGTTAVNDGTLKSGANNVLPNTTAVTLANAAGVALDLAGFTDQILSLAGGGTSGGNVTLGAGTLTIGGNTTTTFDGDISGAGGALTLSGGGTLILGANDSSSYTGATTLTNGTLIVNGAVTASTIGIAASGVLGGSGTVATVNSTSGTLSPGNASTATLSTGTVTLDATSNYNVTLNGTSAGAFDRITSSTSVNLGSAILNLTFTNPSPVIGDVYTIVSATTAVNGTFSGLANNASIVIGGRVLRINYTATTVTLTDVQGTFTWTGGGANNNWTTAANWDLGSAPVPLSDLIFPAGAARETTGNNDLANDFDVKSISFTGDQYTIVGNRIDLFSGGITVTAGAAAHQLNLAEIQLFANQTWSFATAFSTTSTISLSDGVVPLTLTTSGAGNATFSGNLQDVAAGGALTKGGTGQLTLSGAAANTFTGATTVNDGVLQLNKTAGIDALAGSLTIGDGAGGAASVLWSANNQLPNTTAVTIASDGTLNLNGLAETIGHLSGVGAVTLGAGTLTTGDASTTVYSGIISGSNLTVQGSGVFTLSGVNTHSGTTSLTGGTLSFGNNSALGTSAFSISNGTTIRATATRTIGNAVSVVANAGFTIDGAQDLTLSGTINLNAGTSVITVSNTGKTTTFSNIVSNGALTKTGADLLVLSGANTYAGTTTVNGGTLRLSGGAAIVDTGSISLANTVGVVLDVATAEIVGSLTGGASSSVTLNAGLTTGGNNSSTNYDGVISGGSGLTKAGTGVFTLTAANTYTGATVINNGDLRVTGSTAAASAVTINSGGTLSGTGTVGGSVTVTATNTGTVSPGSGAPGKLTVGSVSFSDANATFVAQLNGTTAGTQYDQLSAGTVTLNNCTLNASLGFTSAVGDTFRIIDNTGGGAITGTFNGLAEGASVTIGGRAFTISYVGGTGNDCVLTRVGQTFTWTGGGGALTGWSVATNWDQGILVPLSGDSLIFPGAVAGNSNNDLPGLALGTIQLTGAAGGYNITGLAVSTTGLTAGNSAGSNTIALPVNGAGGVTVNGGGTLVLSGNNGFTGATSVSANSILEIQSTNALGTNAAGTTVAAGSTLRMSGGIIVVNEGLTLNGTGVGGLGALQNLSGSNAWNGTIAMASDSTLGVANAADTLSVGGVVSGGFNLTKVGAGILVLSNANTYSGLTTVSAGTLNVRNDTGLGTTAGGTNVSAGALLQLQGGINVGAESLTLTGTGSLENVIGVNSWSGTIDVGATSTLGVTANQLTVSGAISGAGNALTKVGTGVLILSGANSYGAGTNINDGTLRLGGAVGTNRIPDGSVVTLANLATAVFDVNGNTETIGTLSGGAASSITLGAGTLTINQNANAAYNGTISGAGGNLIKTGTFTLTLGNTGNNYTGQTQVVNGTLQLGASGVIPDASSVIMGNSASAILDLNNFNETIANLSGGGGLGGNITLGSGTLTVTQTSALSYNGVISGTGGLTLAAGSTNTLTLGGVNTYSGATVVTAATLAIGIDNALSATTAVSLANGTTLDLSVGAGFNDTIGSLAGVAGSTVKLAAGKTLAAGANNGSTAFNGTMNNGGAGTFAKQGTGTLTNGGTINVTNLSVANGGSILNNSSITVANPLTVGTGTLTQGGAGTLTVGGGAGVWTVVLNASAGGNTVTYNGTTQDVAPSATYFNLVLDSSTKTMSAGTNRVDGAFTLQNNATTTMAAATDFNGTITVNAGSTLSAGNFSHTMSGNFVNAGTFNANGSTFTFDGGVTQNITGTTTFFNVTINNSVAGSNAIALQAATNLIVGNNLVLQLGSINVGTTGNIVDLTSTASAAVTFNRTGTGHVFSTAGNATTPVIVVRKAFAAGAAQAITFHVGSDATNYTPAALANIDLTGSPAGTLSAGTVAATRSGAVGTPLPTAGGLNTALTRFWTVTNTGLTLATSYDATFTFINAADLGTATPNVSTFVIRRLSAGNWFTTNTTARTATSATATGIKSFSDFECGNDTAAPTITAGSLGALNAFVDITVSEPIFTNAAGNGLVTAADFIAVITNTGTGLTATAGTPTRNDNSPLQGDELIIRIPLTFNHLPLGGEKVQILPFDAASIFDSAGNAMAAAQVGSPQLTLVDQTSPTVTSVTAPAGTHGAQTAYIAGEVITFTVNFTEPVQFTALTPQLSLAFGNATRLASLSAGTTINTLASSYTFTYTVVSGDFALDLDYSSVNSISNPGVITDAVGNVFAVSPPTNQMPAPAAVGSLSNTSNVNVDAAVPTITPPANQTINEDTATGSLAITIGDNITPAANLTLTATSNNTGLIPNAPANLTLGGAGTARTIVVTPLANANGVATITLTVTDNVNLQTTATFNVTVSPVNDNPVISLPNNGTALAYTEGGAGAAIDGGATATDVDSNAAITQNTGITQSFPGTLTVTLDNGESLDVLSINNQGTGAGQVGSVGGALTFGGLSVGTFTTSFTGSATFFDATAATSTVGNTTITYSPGQTVLTVTFNFGGAFTAANAYAAAAAVMQNVTYSSNSERPASNTRTATFQLLDAAGGASNSTARQITVTEVNDAPVVTVDIGTPGIPGTPGNPNMAFNDQTVTGFSPTNGDGATVTTIDQIPKVVLPSTGGQVSPVTFTATATDADDALTFTWSFTNTATNAVSTFSGTGAFALGIVTGFSTTTPPATPNTLGNTYSISNTAVVEFSVPGIYTVSVQVSDGRPTPLTASGNAGTATYTHGANGTEVESTSTLRVNTPPRVDPNGDLITLNTFVPSQDAPITFTLSTVTTNPPGTVDQDGHSLTYTVDFGDGDIEVFPGNSAIFSSSGNTITFTHTYTTLPPNIQPGVDGSVEIPVTVTITDGQTGADLGTVTVDKLVVFANPIIGAADTVDAFNPDAPAYLGLHSSSQKGGGVRFTAVGCSTKGPPTVFVYGIGKTPQKITQVTKVASDKEEVVRFNAGSLTEAPSDMYTFGVDFGRRNGGQAGVFVVEVTDADGFKIRKLYAVTQQVINGTDPATQDVNVAASFITGKMHFDPAKDDLVTFRGRFSFVSTVAKQAVADAGSFDLTKFEFLAPSAKAPKKLSFVIGVGNLLVQAEATGTTGKVLGVFDSTGKRLSSGEKSLFRFKLPKSTTPKYTVNELPGSKPKTFEALPITNNPNTPFGAPIKDFQAVLDLKISLKDAAASGMDTEGVSKTSGNLATSDTKVFNPIDNLLNAAHEALNAKELKALNLQTADEPREDSRVTISAGTNGKATFHQNFRDLKAGTLRPLGIQVVLFIDNGVSQVVFASKIPTGFLVRNGFGQLAGKK